MADGGDPVGIGFGFVGVIGGDIPVGFDFEVEAVTEVVEGEVVAGHEFADATEEGAIAGGVAKGEVFGQKVVFGLSGDGGVFEEGFDFRGEGEGAGTVPIVVKGLDAEAVAGGKEGAFGFIPDGEGEHAAVGLEALGAVLFVGVEEGFGIAAGGVAMAGGFEGGSEGGVVEDFAIEDNPGGSVFVGHGLVAAMEVDDGEAAVAERDAVGLTVEEAEVVGSTVADGRGHALQNRSGGRGRLDRNKAGNAAHLVISVLGVLGWG